MRYRLVALVSVLMLCIGLITHDAAWVVLSIVLALASFISAGLHWVPEGEVDVVLRRKRFSRFAGPGLIWVMPRFEEIGLRIPTHTRTHTFDLKDIRTLDGERLGIEMTVSYHLDPRQVVRESQGQLPAWIEQNWLEILRNKLYAVLGDVIGSHTRSECERGFLLSEDTRKQVELKVAEAVRPWGIIIARPEGVWFGHVQFVKIPRRRGEAPPGRISEAKEWPPVTFRRELVSQLISRIKSGASCCILGANGSGKGNLLLFLSRPHVHAHYLSNEAEHFVFLLLSYGLLAQRPNRSIFELALDCLCHDTNLASKSSPETQAYLRELHEQCTAEDNHLGQFRYLDLAVKHLCKEWRLHLVFLIDEFDEFRRVLDRDSLFALRRLRDSCKEDVCYVLAMMDAHWPTESGLQECEDFCELFTHNVFGLSPYNRRDTRILITRKAAELNLRVWQRDVALLTRVTRGHPGLLVAALPLVLGDKIDVDGNVLEQLLQNIEVKTACRKIYYDLPDEEQQVLAQIARGLPTNRTQNAAVDALRALYLVQERDGALSVTYPLFEAYLTGIA